MPQEYYGGNPNNRKNNDSKMVPWWLIIGCFVVGLFPVGVILLIIRLVQENNGNKQGSGQNRYGSYSGQTGWNEEARKAADRARAAAERFKQQGSSWAGESEADRMRREQDAYRNAYGKAKTPTDKVIYEDAGSGKAAGGKKKAGTSNTSTAKTGGAKKARSTQPHYSADSRARLEKIRGGSVLSFLGGACMLVGAIATASTFWAQLPFLASEPMWFLQEALGSMVVTALGAGMFLFGHLRKGRSKKYRRYINLIGDQAQISIDALAKAYPAKHSAVVSALEDMIDNGVFGEQAYLDYARDLLVLDGSGVRPEEEKAEPKADTKGDSQEHALLAEIRAVNAAIAHPEMSRKIDRIGEITEAILEFQQEHPERSAELKKFLNYYLPTTLKILRSYAAMEKQGGTGENVTAAKQRIEGMMDMVVTGFERQLDKLFAGDMMDIAADITVMEQMMAGDGLFGQETFTKQTQPKGSEQEQQGAH